MPHRVYAVDNGRAEIIQNLRGREKIECRYRLSNVRIFLIEFRLVLVVRVRPHEFVETLRLLEPGIDCGLLTIMHMMGEEDGRGTQDAGNDNKTRPRHDWWKSGLEGRSLLVREKICWKFVRQQRVDGGTINAIRGSQYGRGDQ